jgi:hypothetical protein
MAETAETQVRITNALTYVERQLALARDYQSAAIVKAAGEYIVQLEKTIEDSKPCANDNKDVA